MSGTTTEPQEEPMKIKSKSIYMKQYMQKRRKDKNFRSKERVKECDAKQLARVDKNFRSKERVKERDAKQLARKDEDFRIQERDAKRLAREDEDFRIRETAKDLQRKRGQRSNPLNLEQERLSKQNHRRNNPDKDRNCNKLSKKRRREDEEFLQHEHGLKRRKIHGSTIGECIKKFQEKIMKGPSYVCTCCHQTWFRDYVENVKNIRASNVQIERYSTKVKSVDDV